MNTLSSDVLLGLPFNIASYSVLAHLIAHEVGLTASRVSVSIGDCHLYSNHIEQAKEHFIRGTLDDVVSRLDLSKYKDNGRSILLPETTKEIRVDELGITGYGHKGKLSAPVAI